MTTSLLLNRAEEYRRWRCRGRVEGDALDDDAPREFVIERADSRWLMTAADGALVAVGDDEHDLVQDDGELVELPPGEGFQSYAADMLRQTGSLSWDFIASLEVIATTVSEHAGRPAVDVELQHDEYNLALGIDTETGIWTWLQIDATQIVVDALEIDPAEPSPLFELLDRAAA